MPPPNSTERKLLEAVAFAARAHHGQARKDGKTPYVSHPLRVCLIVRHLFGVDDSVALTAALLHDTIEDTGTDYDELAEEFGPQAAGWAAQLTKDMRLPEPERERAYRVVLAAAPWQVKVCKLADIFDNLLDAKHLSHEQRNKTCRRSREYLAVLNDPALPEPARRAYNAVTELLAEVERSQT